MTAPHDATLMQMLVRQYISAMETDNVEGVKRLSRDPATLEYPGGLKFPCVERLLEWSKTRHKGIRHMIEDIRIIASGTDAVAYVDGILRGTWMDDTTFEGIRFIYKFDISGDCITYTRLWSDVADTILKNGRTTT
jgi:hypothetical protein